LTEGCERERNNGGRKLDRSEHRWDKGKGVVKVKVKLKVKLKVKVW